MMLMFIFLMMGAADTPAELTFNLEMSLGTEEAEDDLLLSADTLFTVQDNGDIAILDAGNRRVLLFSEQGEYLLTTGSEGEGPGEFSSPSEITSDKQGNLYVFDAQALKICVFDRRGTYQKTLRLPTGVVGLLQPVILDNGNIVLSSVQLDENSQQVYMMGLYTPQMKLIKKLSSRAQPVLDWNQANTSAFWVTFLKDHLEGLGKGIPLAAATGDGFVAVETNVYAGTIWDATGKERGQFSRSIRPLLMNDAMKEAFCEEVYQKVTSSGDVSQYLPHGVYLKAKASAELPAAVNPITHLFSTGSGYGLLVNYDVVKQSGRVELFDHQGQYQQGGAFEGLAAEVKWSRNKWYVMGEDEDGNRVLHRYNVKGLMPVNHL